MGMGIDFRFRMAKRAAQEIENGMVVNLGIGIPSLVPNYMEPTMNVWFQAENGIVGMGASPEKGKEDAHLCNAGGFPVMLQIGGAYCDSATAFAMIRRKRIHLAVLGALQVSEQGDLANWMVPGKKIPGMGGAMELAEKAQRVIVLMNHTDKHGKSKLVPECSFPLTAEKSVNLIITDRGVFEVTEEGLLLKEVFFPYTVSEIRECTDASFTVCEKVKVIH